MKYFQNFPSTLFQISPPSYRKKPEFVSLVDITRNVRFKKEVLDNISLYDVINIPENDTIENLSERLYGSPDYYWVLMLLNDRFDYAKDLPLGSAEFETYVERRYNPTLVSLASSSSILADISIGELTGDSVDSEITYLEVFYGLTPRTLIVEFKQDNGLSVDINQDVRVINRSNNTVEIRPVMSVNFYDDVLGIQIKRYFYKDTNQRLDTKTHRIDMGAIPNLRAISIYNREQEQNDLKRTIRVIDENLLSTVLNNFRDLL